MINPETILIDARNWPAFKAGLISEISQAKFVGFDIETEDSQRHEGLNVFMKVKNGKKSVNTPLVFDINRTTVTGFSWYCKDSSKAYYLNLKHADVENRIPWEEARQLLDAKRRDAYWIAHNAPFEITMMKTSLKYNLGKNIICVMQMAVSAWNDDTYSKSDFYKQDLVGINRLFPAIKKEFKDFQLKDKLTAAQEDLLFKVIAKQSTTEHSYNGWVKKIAFGYGLKRLAKRFLNYEQTTFEEILGNKKHMGELTGEEVCKYGADDAWVAVELLNKIQEFIVEKSPEVMDTFLKQENPMTRIYSDVWKNGLRVDTKRIYEAREHERYKAATILRRMKKAVKALLPFPEDPHEKLLKYDKWFANNWEKYRQQVEDWANTPDSEDTFEQHYQVRSPISIPWAKEKGLKPSEGINILHYMPLRTLLYDLCRFSYIQHEGKTQSNGEAREKMRERWIKKHGEIKGDAARIFLDCVKGLSDSEQSMKLYITNYLNLTDSETNRMYPVLNSMLNSRRMALSFPNVSQLAKGSDIAYVRSFFLADQEDHVLISADWSSVELVIIGELSGDSGFREAFGQLPYKDLHTKAAAGGLGISVKELKAMEEYKNLRRDIGKGSNFNYWYSGALGTVAERMGWTSEEMWVKVDGYRSTFPEGEQWRLETISEIRRTGEVVLPDGHKRYRFEATNEWAAEMQKKFRPYGKEIMLFGELVIKKIRSRAGNQGVNSKVQGTGATLAKRSILKMEDIISQKGYNANFKFPCHDELIYSVHKDDVVDFIQDLRMVMNTHPSIIKELKLTCTVAIGNNYWEFHSQKNPYGQIELDEVQKKVPCVDSSKYGKSLNDLEIQKVVDYLMEQKG